MSQYHGAMEKLPGQLPNLIQRMPTASPRVANNHQIQFMVDIPPLRSLAKQRTPFVSHAEADAHRFERLKIEIHVRTVSDPCMLYPKPSNTFFSQTLGVWI